MSHSVEPEPPWIAFPRIPWGSAGWRMGFGEAHWVRWQSWFRSTSADARAVYEATWPEPPGWEGFYAFIATGKPPPWFVERERRIAAAAAPPREDEREIRDPFRIAWMLQNYLKWPSVRVRLLNYGLGDPVYRDLEGNAWCLAEPRGEGTRPVYLYRYDGVLIGEDNLPVDRPLP